MILWFANGQMVQQYNPLEFGCAVRYLVRAWSRSCFGPTKFTETRRHEYRASYYSMLSWLGEVTATYHVVNVAPTRWAKYVEDYGEVRPALMLEAGTLIATTERKFRSRAGWGFQHDSTAGDSRPALPRLPDVLILYRSISRGGLWHLPSQSSHRPDSQELCARGIGRAGLCSACGYDLRGSRDRCPECGIIARKLERKRNLKRGHNLYAII